MVEGLDDSFVSKCADRFNLNLDIVKAKARELETQTPAGGWRSIRAVMVGACKRLAGWEPAEAPAQPDPSTIYWSSQPCLCYACRNGFPHGSGVEEIQAIVRGRELIDPVRPT